MNEGQTKASINCFSAARALFNDGKLLFFGEGGGWGSVLIFSQLVFSEIGIGFCTSYVFHLFIVRIQCLVVLL